MSINYQRNHFTLEKCVRDHNVLLICQWTSPCDTLHINIPDLKQANSFTTLNLGVAFIHIVLFGYIIAGCITGHTLK